MRKWMALLLVPSLCVLLFVSCKQQAGTIAAEDVVTSFSANVQVTQEDSVILCTISRTPESIAAVTVTEPQQLNGMRFEWRGSGYGISYNGITCETEKPFLPNTSFAAALVNALTEAAKPEGLAFEAMQEERALFSGTCDSGRFQIWVNNANGLIEQLTVDELKLKAVFTEIQTT